jgi:hypothetical protein
MEAELVCNRSTLAPKFIYSYRYNTGKLHRTNLLTGEQSTQQIPGYQFKFGCRWSELPGRYLLVTGGLRQGTPTWELEKMDTLRECAVSSQHPMHTAGFQHAQVYHSQYLYVVGGYMGTDYLRECERYVCTERRWEVLPALSVGCSDMSVVVLENSLYALGGEAKGNLDTVQQLSLDRLT